MNISASDVKNLRDRTGVSMMECKGALVEADGNMDEAIEILRKRGVAKAAKKGDRIAAEGIISAIVEGGKGALVQLYCETDFVARNSDFVALAEKIAKIVLEKGAEKGKEEADSMVKDAILKLGEKIEIGEIKELKGSELGSYVHSNGKFAAIVAMKGGDDEMRHDIAMHISVTDPENISSDEISEELVAREREVWVAAMAEDKKPPEIVEKIMAGKEKKFREEKALLTQAFIKDAEKTVEAVLEGAIVEGFIRLAI